MYFGTWQAQAPREGGIPPEPVPSYALRNCHQKTNALWTFTGNFYGWGGEKLDADSW
jgi:hypothetical protein